MTTVNITTAGHTVIVECDDGDLDEVADKALELWKATRTPGLDRAFGVSGFTSERAEPMYAQTDADLRG